MLDKNDGLDAVYRASGLVVRPLTAMVNAQIFYSKADIRDRNRYELPKVDNYSEKQYIRSINITVIRERYTVLSS
jgi:hypothetical protein